jgi:hypothetical protein
MANIKIISKNTINNENVKNNQSMEMLPGGSTIYAKKANPNKSMTKKISMIKKSYVSPYSQRVVFGKV